MVIFDSSRGPSMDVCKPDERTKENKRKRIDKGTKRESLPARLYDQLHTGRSWCDLVHWCDRDDHRTDRKRHDKCVYSGQCAIREEVI